jgi:hypothetical protein
MLGLLPGCGGSHGTSPSRTVVISDLQARVPPRLVADRPFAVEVSVAASAPKRLVDGQAHLRPPDRAGHLRRAP